MSQNRQVTLVLDTTNPHHRRIVRGVGTYAHEKGNWDFHLVQDPLENLPYLRQDPLEDPPDLRSWRTDGMITTFHTKKIALKICSLKVPVVGVEAEYGCWDPDWQIPNFATDNDAIGRLGAEDLIERGLKSLAFCGIPHARLTGWSAQRQQAFQRCAEEAGIPCSVFVGGSSSDRKTAKLHQDLSAWLDSLDKPVGLMACYDVRARHVLTACRNLGLLVPEDVAVIGVDNDELMCELTNPPLSSIEQGSLTIGYQAAALLDQLMAGGTAPQLKSVVKPEGVVTRRSSDTLALDDADVAAAMRFIRQQACAGIQVDDVVQAVAVSRSSLESRFKAATGRTIHTQIQRVKVDRARQLLAATDLPLKKIAVEVGFRYVQHLITIFRRHAGCTPGDYRRRSRE
jgi:LacI family transcriptional regulator